MNLENAHTGTNTHDAGSIFIESGSRKNRQAAATVHAFDPEQDQVFLARRGFYREPVRLAMTLDFECLIGSGSSEEAQIHQEEVAAVLQLVVSAGRGEVAQGR